MVAGSVTMTTKANLPSVQDEVSDRVGENPKGKSMYMAAGSGSMFPGSSPKVFDASKYGSMVSDPL